MKSTEFVDLAKRFAKRPVLPPGGGRHVYVWRDDADALVTQAPRDAIVRLDLHQLVHDLVQKPDDTQAARRTLESALQTRLRQLNTRDGKQRMLLVSGCDLLMRYRVTVSAFFQIVDDNCMVVFLAPDYGAIAQPLPSFVEFRPTATFDYLKSLLPESVVIE